MSTNPSREDLDQFIESQHRDGKESAPGAFTVSAARAREKMREFQLSNPGSYLAKFVQAAVACGAASIDIKVGRATLSLEFETEDPELSNPEPLLESILTVHALRDSPLRHMATGFNAVPEAEISELRWETPGGTAVLTETGLTIEEHTYLCARLVVKKKLKILKWFRGTAFVDEIRFLTQRCGYCSCEIRLDGRSLQQKNWHGFASAVPDDIGLSNAQFILETESKEPGSLPPLLFGREHFETQDEGKYLIKDSILPTTTVLAPRESPDNCLFKFAVRPSLEAQGELGLVKHGVLMQRKTLDLAHPAVVVLCQADDLTTDLSEFQVVENEPFQKRLNEIRSTIRTETEGLSFATVRRLLESVGFRGQRLETRALSLHHWFQFHESQAPRNFMAHLENSFAQNDLHLAPDIPLDKEGTVRMTHQAHLPDSESIVAIYDDTVLHSAKTGFVLTPTRICWKDVLQYPQYILWENLDVGELRLEGNKLALMQTEISFSLNGHIMRRLASFFRGIPALELPQKHKLEGPAETIRTLSLQHLGKHPGVFYFPYIVPAKVKKAKASLAPQIRQDEVFLVLYDDTLFGGADTGFALTYKRLYWRNVLGEPHSLSWNELRDLEISVGNSCLEIGDQRLSIFRSTLHRSVVDLLRELAVSLTCSSEPGQRSN